ncbi:MAG: S-layer homology domain-containing protein [Clostridia bacterium]|nr:S-layer homology domain-containing protein [Clostridia bacterium]
MNRLKKIIAAMLGVMLLLTSVTLPALANDVEYEAVTSSADVTSYYYQYGSAKGANPTGIRFTDNDSSTNGGRGQAWDIVWIDLGKTRRIDAVKVQINDGNMAVPSSPMIFYVTNDEPGAGVAASIEANGKFVAPSSWKSINGDGHIWTKTGISEATYNLDEGGNYRYVICTSPTRDFVNDSSASSCGMVAYVSEITPYKDAAYVEEGNGGEVTEPIDAVELATGKAVFTYGSLDGTDPALAVDGDSDTYWKSVTETGGVNKSIVVDLGADCVIEKYAIIPNATGTAKNLKVYGATEAKPGTRVFHKDIVGVFDMNVGKSITDSGLGYITWDEKPTYRYLTFETTNSVFEISDISIMGAVADGGEAKSESVVRITDNATIYASNDGTQYNMTIDAFANRGNVADTNPSTSFGMNQGGESGVIRITYDLGAEMSVSYMVYQYSGMEDYGNNLTLFATNSLDKVFDETNVDKIGFIEKPVFVNSNTGLLVFEVPEEFKDNKYRYVGIYKKDYALNNLRRLSANSLYAYSSESAIEDLIEGDAGYNILSEKTTLDLANVLSYDASVVAASGSYGFTGLFGTRGEDGGYIETAYAKDDMVRGVVGFDSIKLSKEIAFPGVWEGIILDGLKVLSAYTDMAKGTKIESAELGSATEPVFNKIGNSITLGGKASGALVGMVVLKPGADFDDFTEDDIVAHKVVYAPESAKDAWNFNINYTLGDELATGDYTIGLFCDGNASEISGKTFAAEKLNLDEIVEVFENVTEDNFEELVEENRNFFGDTADLLLDSETMAESFVLAKEAFAQGLFDKTITEWNVDALSNTAMAAIVVDKTLNSTDFAEDIAPFVGSMPDVFGKDYEADEFEEIFPAVLKNTEILNAQDLADAYKKANVLSIIANGKKKEIEKVIKENSDLLGISESTLKKVTPLQIAAGISTKLETVAGSYAGGMDDAAKEIAKKLSETSGSGGKVLGGGGSGGGGGNSSFVASVAPSVPQASGGQSASNEASDFAAASYNDLGGYDWAADSIKALSARGIINGKGYGVFDPAGRITREEAVKLLVTATGTPTDESYNGYDDCVIGSWYYPYITAAKINNLVTGFTRTQFGLGSAVTRQDLAVMIYRAMQKQGLVEAVEEAEFADEAAIADYALEAVKALGGMGIITGFEDGSFAPNANASRAEAAVIFARYINLADDAMAEEGTK